MFILLSFYFTIRFIFGNSKPKSTSEQKIGIGKLTLQHLVHSSMFLRVFGCSTPIDVWFFRALYFLGSLGFNFFLYTCFNVFKGFGIGCPH